MASFFNIKGTTQNEFQIGINGPILKRKDKNSNDTIILPNNIETNTIILNKGSLTEKEYTGNSATATKLANAKNFSFHNGIVLTSIPSFDGSSNIDFNIKSIDATLLINTIPWNSIKDHGGTTATNFALGNHNHDKAYLHTGMKIKTTDKSKVLLPSDGAIMAAGDGAVLLELSLDTNSVETINISDNAVTSSKIGDNEILLKHIVKGDYSNKIDNVASANNVSNTISGVALSEIFTSTKDGTILSKVKNSALADSANKLSDPISIWGQSFDGSTNISGDLSNVGNIIPSINDSSNIGTDTNRYKNLYLSNELNSDSVNSKNGTFENSVTAKIFKGDLTGNASSSSQLNHNIILWGHTTNLSANTTIDGTIENTNTITPKSTNVSSLGSSTKKYKYLHLSETAYAKKFDGELGDFSESVETPKIIFDKNAEQKIISYIDKSDYTGNAATATKLKTAVTLWGQSFDGSANISGDATIDNLTVKNIVPSESKVYNIGEDSNRFGTIYTQQNISNNINSGTGTFTNLNVTNKIEGTASHSVDTQKFNEAKTIELTGDISGSDNKDGSSGWSIATTLKDVNATTGVFGNNPQLTNTTNSVSFNVPKFTVDSKGRITNAETKEIKYNFTDTNTYISNATFSTSQNNISLILTNSGTKITDDSTITASNFPLASITQAGAISTIDQTLKGIKTFNSGIKLGSNDQILNNVITSGIIDDSHKELDKILTTQGYVDKEIKTAVTNASVNAMEFKGTVEIKEHPETKAKYIYPEIINPEKGNFYKVKNNGDYSALTPSDDELKTLKKGDSLIYDGEKWLLIPSGDDIEDTWRTIQINNTSIGNTTLNLIDGTNVTLNNDKGKVSISAIDTKNTAGNKNKINTKLFLIGSSTNTGDNSETYTNENIYIDTSNKLHATVTSSVEADKLSHNVNLWGNETNFANPSNINGNITFSSSGGSISNTKSISGIKDSTITGFKSVTADSFIGKATASELADESTNAKKTTGTLTINYNNENKLFDFNGSENKTLTLLTEINKGLDDNQVFKYKKQIIFTVNTTSQHTPKAKIGDVFIVKVNPDVKANCTINGKLVNTGDLILCIQTTEVDSTDIWPEESFILINKSTFARLNKKNTFVDDVTFNTKAYYKTTDIGNASIITTGDTSDKIKVNSINSDIPETIITIDNVSNAKKVIHKLTIGNSDNILEFNGSKDINLVSSNGIGLIKNSDNKTISIEHTNILLDTLNFTQEPTITLESESTFKVPNITTDINGHLTSLTESTFTMPSLINYVTGPSSTTDNAIAIYDGTSGKIIKNSSAIIENNILKNNKIETGTDDASYFQSRRFRGQGDASSYQHAIDFGYAGHNQVDFYEYGATWNFWKNQQKEASTTQSALILGITAEYLSHMDKKYKYPDNSGTIALLNDIDSKINTNNTKYLPLSGGQMTGPIALADADGQGILFGGKNSNININDGGITKTLVGFYNGPFTLGHNTFDTLIRSKNFSLESEDIVFNSNKNIKFNLNGSDSSFIINGKGNADISIECSSVNTDYASITAGTGGKVLFLQPNQKGFVNIGGIPSNTAAQDHSARLIVDGDIKEGTQLLKNKYYNTNTQVTLSYSSDAQPVGNETLLHNGSNIEITLNRIAKTGSYDDLSNKPITILSLNPSSVLTQDQINLIKNESQIVYIKCDGRLYRQINPLHKKTVKEELIEVIDYISFGDETDPDNYTKRFLLEIYVKDRTIKIIKSQRFAEYINNSTNTIGNESVSITKFDMPIDSYFYTDNGTIGKKVITNEISGGIIAKTKDNVSVTNTNKIIYVNKLDDDTSIYNENNEIILQSNSIGKPISQLIFQNDYNPKNTSLTKVHEYAAARIDKVFDIVHHTRAMSKTFGGIKLYSEQSFNKDITAIIGNEENKNYAVQLDQTGRAFVNVPWKDFNENDFVKKPDLDRYVTLSTSQIITGDKIIANDNGLKISNAAQTNGSASMKYNADEECLEFVFA